MVSRPSMVMGMAAIPGRTRRSPHVEAGDTENSGGWIYDYGDKCIVFETRGLSVDNSADEEINQISGDEVSIPPARNIPESPKRIRPLRRRGDIKTPRDSARNPGLIR